MRDSDDPRPSADDATASLAALVRAIDELEAAAGFRDGIHGLTEWLERVSAAIDSIPVDDVAGTREEVGALIERLLDLNARIQGLVRLKRLLS